MSIEYYRNKLNPTCRAGLDAALSALSKMPESAKYRVESSEAMESGWSDVSKAAALASCVAEIDDMLFVHVKGDGVTGWFRVIAQNGNDAVGDYTMSLEPYLRDAT